MPKFRKKPVVIEAEEWPKEPCWGVVRPYTDQLPDSKKTGRCMHCRGLFLHHGWIPTLEGGHIVCPGDRIIKGIAGEFYPCKPNIFKATYDPVEDIVLRGDGAVPVSYVDRLAGSAAVLEERKAAVQTKD